MPSYRVTLAVGALDRSTDPATVLPATADAVAALATVEATDIAVVRGQARITVRFMVDTDVAAAQVGLAAYHRVEEMAEASPPRVTRRWGNRWHPLR
ncbi:hypothetical protein CLV28_1028 [Sediminihabitans luteus]|uniref:Uncharacterized protein n=1 Tax=Sediminihabitans luteus TaxID=1138585 RepID=A0A2M9D0T1_9CELL|nr:hypothetical protein [Sediminihabitans luteus]PJJ77802.1 hypothetical protein CLV28_1028 [Sediminihabitans luteus]GII99840.1 hypothetical protein Slu03_22180 [Sediminihabitans luteus]